MTLSWTLIAITALYYFGLFAGAATYPGYSHMTNYASELGAAAAAPEARLGPRFTPSSAFAAGAPDGDLHRHHRAAAKSRPHPPTSMITPIAAPIATLTPRTRQK